MAGLLDLDEAIADLSLEGLLPAQKRGMRANRPALEVEVIRPLTAEDLPSLGFPQGTRVEVRRLTHSHHRLAQLVVKGADTAEISAATGWSPKWIRQLCEVPDIQELIGTYRQRKDDIFLDVMERLKVLGLSTIDELQHRLEKEPDDLSTRELIEIAELLLVKSQVMQKEGGGGLLASRGSNVAVNVKFVTSEPKKAGAEISVDAIELECEDVA